MRGRIETMAHIVVINKISTNTAVKLKSILSLLFIPLKSNIKL